MSEPVVLVDVAWQDRGRCRDVDQELFYPPPERESARRRQSREAAAKAVCAPCPVRVECLTWALDSGEQYGVWGGMTERERDRLARRRTDPRRQLTVVAG